MIETGMTSKLELEKTKETLYKNFFGTKFNFLKDHNGLRPGELLTVLAPKGGGKSTLVKTLVCESLQYQKKTYCYLSEEKADLYKIPIVETFLNVMRKNNVSAIYEKSNTFLNNLLLESEFTIARRDREITKFFIYLEESIKNNEIDIVFFDNFTTSFLGSGSIKEQALAITSLKEIAVKYQIPIVLVLHTTKGTDIYKEILDGDKVRGNATSVNMGSYNYLVATFFRCSPPRTFLIVDKARYHSKSNKQVYEMFYNNELGILTNDVKSSYNELKQLLKGLNSPTIKEF